MRVVAMHFESGPSGDADFAHAFDRAAHNDRRRLLALVERLSDAVVTPDQRRSTALTIVGFGDRPDDAVGEREARAAWRWIRERVSERVRRAGIEAGDWWDTAPDLTWALVFASTGRTAPTGRSSKDGAGSAACVVLLASLFDAV